MYVEKPGDIPPNTELILVTEGKTPYEMRIDFLRGLSVNSFAPLREKSNGRAQVMRPAPENNLCAFA